MVVWGAVTITFVWANSPMAFYVLRLLLGVAEAGFFPGIVYYLKHWFPQQGRAKAIAGFMIAAPLGSIIVAPLSSLTMVGMNNALGLHGWQWLFITQGVPAILLGVFVYFRLPNLPQNAAWLSVKEKMALTKVLEAERSFGSSANRWSWEDLRSVYLWKIMMAYLALLAATYGVTFWLPTFLLEQGSLGLKDVGTFAMIPAFASLAGMAIAGYLCDRFVAYRRIILMAMTFGGAVAALSLALAQANLAIYLIEISIMMGLVSGSLVTYWTTISDDLGSNNAAFKIALVNTIGNLGGLVGAWAVGWFRGFGGMPWAYAFIAGAMAICFAMCAMTRNHLPHRRSLNTTRVT
jgi:sugar phosphate permease